MAEEVVLTKSQQDELIVEEHRRRVAEKIAAKNAPAPVKMESAEKDEKTQRLDKVHEEEERVFKMLADNVGDDSYKSLVSDCYSELDANVSMVVEGISWGVIVEGKGGVGKTYRILNKSLKECGAENVGYTDSYTTPASFYIWLHSNREKQVLIVDDCAGFMGNDKILAFLKGALWPVGSGQTRVVNYLTTKPLQDEYGEYVPSSCEVNARLIIITNHLDDESPHVKAVLSRVNRVRVDVPRKELLNILAQIIKKDYKELSYDERKMALDFLTTNTTNTTDELNIRTLLRIMDYEVYAKKNNLGDVWKMLSLKLLQQDDRMALVEKLMNSVEFKDEAERYTQFIEVTGDSRATWYRLRKKYEKTQQDKKEAIIAAEKSKAKKGPIVD